MNENKVGVQGESRHGHFESLPSGSRAWIGSVLGDLVVASAEFAMNVGLELLTHLAIVNTVGLAGITALYASVGDGSKHEALSSAGWFLVGLVLAIATVLIVYASTMTSCRPKKSFPGASPRSPTAENSALGALRFRTRLPFRHQ